MFTITVGILHKTEGWSSEERREQGTWNDFTTSIKRSILFPDFDATFTTKRAVLVARDPEDNIRLIEYIYERD